MATQIRLAHSGAPVPSIRRINFNRPLAVGAAMAMWAVILIGIRLMTL